MGMTDKSPQRCEFVPRVLAGKSEYPYMYAYIHVQIRTFVHTTYMNIYKHTYMHAQ